jgi:UDP-glucose 4-epimerase
LIPNTGSHLLITGGLGYVGGRVAAHLAAAAPDASIRLMTHRNHAQAPVWAQGMDVVRADVREPETLRPALDGIDTVVHLAAVDEIVSQRDPDIALEVNGRGTHHLLKACHEIGVKRFIYLSTFHVYGPEVVQPITEQSATRPIHPYSITHRLAEDFVNWYRQSFGLETLILRLSNGYGYPADSLVQRWTLVFNDLCMQAIQNGEIVLRSAGTQHRDFISLTDVGRAVQHFLDLGYDEWRDGLFNLGGDCSMSILDVATMVAAEFSQRYGTEIPITVGESSGVQNDSPVFFNVDKMKQTGFSLTGNMSEEVAGTLELCRELHSNSDQAS